MMSAGNNINNVSDANSQGQDLINVGKGQVKPSTNSTYPKVEVNGVNIPLTQTSKVNAYTNGNGTSTSINKHPSNSNVNNNNSKNETLEVPITEGTPLKRTTSSYSFNNEFIEPKDYTLSFSWKKIGAFIDPEKELTTEEQQNLSMSPSAQKLTTYIYEKYYSDFYWNCSLIVGACFASWMITYIGFGFFSIVFVLICTFAIYRAEFRRFNINIRDDMQRLQSSENLEKKLESMEWLNNFLAKFWIIYMPALSEMVIAQTNQILSTVGPPPPINKLTLDEFTLGTKAPKIDSIRSFTKLGKDLYQMDWALNFTPNDTSDMTQNELRNKVDPKIALGIRIGKGFVGASLPILLENLSFKGNMRIKVKFGDTFPHIDIVSICFLEPPSIDYALKPVGGNTLGIDVMSLIPGLSSFVNGLINSNLAPLMYYPNTIDIKPNELIQPPSAIGVLQVKIRGAEYFSSKPINPYIKYGPENDTKKTIQTDIKEKTTVPIFNESNHILIDNTNSKLKFELFKLIENGDSLSLGETFFELQDLLQDPIIEMNETKLIKNNKNVGKIVYDLKWHSVQKGETLGDGTKTVVPDSDTGILNFNVISASGLDTSMSLVGKLSTYVEAYIDGKLIETSRISKGNNSPEYYFNFENLVYSKSTSILKLIFKDISSYNISTIAEFESKILDLTLFDIGDVDPAKNRITKNFTTGSGSFKFVSIWKPLGSMSSDDEDDTAFVPPIGLFRMNIKSCTDLANIETLGTIDPYIEVVSSGKVKGLTSVVKNSTNPVYDDEFYIPILSENQRLRVNVLDKEPKGKSDRIIGDIYINLSQFIHKESNQNKTVDLESNISRNGKSTGTLNYSLHYYPLLPVFSHQEVEILKQKSADAKEKSQDMDELEEQAKFLEDYKKNPDDYEWVDIDEDVENLINVESNKNKVILSLEELIKYNSGVLGINLVSGSLKTKSAFIQAFVDDHSSPDFISRRSKNGKLHGASGECFIRDLRHSILNFRITRNQHVTYKDEIIYETTTSFNVIELLANGFDKPLEVNLDGNKLELLFEYVPSIESGFETVDDTGLLTIKVLSASNLKSADTNGKSDPYVTGSFKKKQVFKTKTIKKTLNPEFNETFKIPIKSRSKQEMTFQVYDWDMAGDNDYLGEVTVDLKNLPLNKEVVQDFKLNTQGSVKLGFNFVPGYIKPSSSTLLSSPDTDFDMNLGNLGLGAVNVGLGAVGAGVGTATGIASGAVGAVGGVASGITGGFTKKLFKPFEEGPGKNGNSFEELNKEGSPNVPNTPSSSPGTKHSSHLLPHMKLKPSFMGKNHETEENVANISTLSRPSDVSNSDSVARRVPSTNTLQSPKSPFNANAYSGSSQHQLRIPSSPGTINHDNYVKSRTSMDAVSISTTAFNGTGAIAGRLTILELQGISENKEAILVKVIMKSSNGTEKSIYKSKANKGNDGMFKYHENVAFRCDQSSSLVFILRSHHTFGKSEELGRGEIILEQVAGVKENIIINITGKVSGSLVVNFNYA